jgi:hypothetical protein
LLRGACHRARIRATRWLAMTLKHAWPFSRLVFARAFQIRCPSLKREGAGNAGCALHPRSRVPKAAQLAHTSIQGSGEHTDIPCAMVLRLTSCSSRWSELVVTVAPEKRASKELFASIRGARTTRLGRTRQTHSPLDRRVHRIPRPTCRDDGDTPLWWARDGILIILICRNNKQNIFDSGA